MTIASFVNASLKRRSNYRFAALRGVCGHRFPKTHSLEPVDKFKTCNLADAVTVKLQVLRLKPPFSVDNFRLEVGCEPEQRG